MRAFHWFLIVAALAIALAWAIARNSAPRLCLAYSVAVDDPSHGSAEITLRIDNAPTSGVELTALLRDKLINAEIVSAVDILGNPWVVDSHTAFVDISGRSAGFTTFMVHSPTALDTTASLVVRYTVTPTTTPGALPYGEEQHCGIVSDESIVLSATQCLLLPVLSVENLDVEFVAPERWNCALPKRVTIKSPVQSDLLSVALVAAPNLSTASAYGKLELLTAQPDNNSVTSAVQRVLSELYRLLPAPRPGKVIVLPRPNSGLRIQRQAIPDVVVLDTSRPDAASLRDLIRQVIPRWFGTCTIDEPLGSTDWLARGITEYLALQVPFDLGYSTAVPARCIENTWMRGLTIPFSVFDKRKTPIDSPRDRIKSVAAVLAVDQELQPRGGLRSLLKGWDGREHLPEVDSTLVAQALGSETIDQRVVFNFEDKWRPPFQNHPRVKEEPQQELVVIFTANSEGHLESCGCKLGQSGGISRAAAAIDKLQDTFPESLLLDLGGFFPTEKNKATLDPLTATELALYVKAMSAMQYNAVALGERELFYGADVLKSTLDYLKVPYLACGIKNGSESLGLERLIHRVGPLAVGLIAYSEKVQQGYINETQELNSFGITFPTAVAEIVPTLRSLRSEVDCLILIGALSLPSLVALERCGVRIDLVLNALQPGIPGLPDHGWLGNTPVVFDTMMGAGVTKVALGLSAKGQSCSLSVDYVELPRTAERNAEIDKMLSDYFSALVPDDKSSDAGRRILQWDDSFREPFVGAAACAKCHEAQYTQWRNTPHAHAMHTLRSVHRDTATKCVQCHVVGLGYATGYDIAIPNPGLEGVQCEHCHGGGGEHFARPSKRNIRKTPPQAVCTECHDSDHSEGVKQRFPSMWETIRH